MSETPPPAAPGAAPAEGAACGHVSTPPTQPPAPEAPARTLDERFAEAWLNLPHAVCGYRLRPYCLQHALALQLIDSPFVDSAPRPIAWSDLFRAAAICATRFEEHPRAPSYARQAAYILAHGALRRLTRGHLGTTLELECHRFRTYQNDHQSEPDLFFENDGRELTAPILLGRAVYLHSQCGISEERAWTMPIGKALWVYAAHLEQSQPGVTLLDQEETAWYRWVKDIQEGRVPIPPELRPENMDTSAPGATGRIDPGVFGPA